MPNDTSSKSNEIIRIDKKTVFIYIVLDNDECYV